MTDEITARILLVDDREQNLFALEKILERPGLEIMKAGSGNEALALVLEFDFALILLDVQMPDMDGFETAELMRGDEKTKHIPIIFVTAINKEQGFVFKGYESGAVDYLSKPLDPHTIESKVSVFLDLYTQRKLLLDTTKKLKRTIDELKASQKTIKEQNALLKETSLRDELTGLYNRRYMNEILEKEFSRAIRYKTDLSCLLLDIDFFKNINDTYGHTFGDVVLRGISDCLRNNIRMTDVSFRYGGEEFMILLFNTGIEGAGIVAEKIRSTCESTIHQDDTNSKTITISIGVASVKQHQPADGKELIVFADRALYRAKEEGRNRISIYGEEKSGEIKNEKPTSTHPS
ncbi:MAG: diguanylate cyclase [Candidatus Scalindua sp. AMX11]|nr:MAG: diguanylate cyclase [Candidatus Scalindua sp.]NOG84619.1 diguanylate cyclase [Planctomycetota bacterium]RZV92393.1 MAG: diguanylate cyclase [Candidatus Scalindua sp. SCAELEC01]TDE66082.1 MAG: diguanylate cyclase [Candidatus Scalindua sp. AMX11]GJQ59056.1 MAG: diguanylate cyclase response regulator [Candidatus Scalindua sp.]